MIKALKYWVLKRFQAPKRPYSDVLAVYDTIDTFSNLDKVVALWKTQVVIVIILSGIWWQVYQFSF